MKAESVVEVRLEEVAGERLVSLRVAAGAEVVRLRAPEAGDLAVRLLEVAHLARVGRPRSART